MPISEITNSLIECFPYSSQFCQKIWVSSNLFKTCAIISQETYKVHLFIESHYIHDLEAFCFCQGFFNHEIIYDFSKYLTPYPLHTISHTFTMTCHAPSPLQINKHHQRVLNNNVAIRLLIWVQRTIKYHSVSSDFSIAKWYCLKPPAQTHFHQLLGIRVSIHSF